MQISIILYQNYTNRESENSYGILVGAINESAAIPIIYKPYGVVGGLYYLNYSSSGGSR